MEMYEAYMDEAINAEEHEDAIGYAIRAYLKLKEAVDKLKDDMDEMKAVAENAMAHLDIDGLNTEYGSVTMTKGSKTVSYDAKAIDILIADDDQLAARLLPYRKESVREGSLRIKGV
jgi:hypothetical protein